MLSLEDGPLSGELRQRGIEVIILPKRRSYDFIFLFSLLRVIARKKIKLLHAHLLITDIYGWIAAKLSRTPFVITFHGKNLMNLKHGKSVFCFVAEHTDRVVFICDNIKEEIRESLRLPLNNCTTIYNGIDLHKSPVTYSPRIFAKNLGIHSSSLVVGSIGSLRPVKGYEILLEAVPSVAEAFPQVNFLIMGDGVLRDSLELKVKGLKLEKNVIFLGHRDDVSKIIRLFDVFVLPSLTEGVSIALLEAMAASRPVVATNVGGNPEVMVSNKTGLLVPPGSPGALSEAIIKLLQDKPMREQMGKAGRKRVVQHFSLEAFVNKHIELYESLVIKG